MLGIFAIRFSINDGKIMYAWDRYPIIKRNPTNNIRFPLLSIFNM